MADVQLEQVMIDKLVHGGQGIGTLSDGRKVFVWNALPGETVRARLLKRKRSYAEAIAEEILQPSPDRIEPAEPNYLATSPWQIMTLAAENAAKRDITAELFARAHVALPEFDMTTVPEESSYAYRNKMEYSFWGDDGIHLALYERGSHRKHIVTGSALAMPAIDAGARAICQQLNELSVRAGELKTIIVRCTQAGAAAAALYVKAGQFPRLRVPPELTGLKVYYSDPRSPASVPTRLLQEAGDSLLHDELLGQEFVYDADSFWQVNLPAFEQALSTIREHVSADDITDMYAGVGSIGLSVARRSVTLVELDPASTRMAGQNADTIAAARGLHETRVIEASTEKVLEYIVSGKPVIFDPPRAGLHDRVTARVLEVLPPQVIYLSCNPATQARDLALLQEAYDIKHFAAYNFFPRTPHIETLAVLQRK